MDIIGLKGAPLITANNQVIKQFHTKEFTGLHQGLCNVKVLKRRGCLIGRMVVGNNDGGAGSHEGRAKNFAGPDNGGIDVALIDQFIGDDAVLDCLKVGFSPPKTPNPWLKTTAFRSITFQSAYED
jgi:hypothetical protein